MTDLTKALIWSTYSSTGYPQLKLLHGNPATYVPDIANRGNGSYFSNDYTFSAVVGIGALDMLYSESYIYFALDMKLQFVPQNIPRNVTAARYVIVAALSNMVNFNLNSNNFSARFHF